MPDAIGAPVAPAATIVELPERPVAVVRIDGPVTEISRLIGEAFELTATAIAASGATIAGPPFTRYHAFGGRIVAEAGFPFVGTLDPTDRVYRAVLPGGRAVVTTHVGPYADISRTWEGTQAWMRGQGLEPREAPWEQYLTGPDEPEPTLTEIVFPVR